VSTSDSPAAWERASPSVRPEDLWPFLVDSLYGLDAIDAVEANERLDAAELPDPVRRTIPMAQVHGRAR